MRLLSCLFPCVKNQGSVAAEVDISTPFEPHWVDSSISDPSTDDHQVPRFRAAQRYFYQSSCGRHESAEDDRTQQPPSTVDGQHYTPTNAPSMESQDEAVLEVDITAGEISDDEDSDSIGAKGSSTGCIEGSEEGCTDVVVGDMVSPPCLDLVRFHAEVTLPHQPGPTAGRISRDSDEVEELEKVERWQRGRAVLGNNNLLRHRCDPGAPRRRGILDFYNQRNALVGHPEEMTAIIFSGPSDN